MKNTDYQLTTEDVQTVAIQEINRKLSLVEIESLKELIAEKIHWYDVISDAISEKLIFNEKQV